MGLSYSAQLERRIESISTMVINLKIIARQTKKDAGKSEQEVKKAIAQNNCIAARKHASHAILLHHQAQQFEDLRLDLELLRNQVRQYMKTSQVIKQMEGIVTTLNVLDNHTSVQKAQKIVTQFQFQMENLETKTEMFQDVMEDTSSSMTPTREVDQLIGKIADAHHLHLGESFSSISVPSTNPVQEQQQEQEDQGKGKEPVAAAEYDYSDLEERIAQLKK